MLSGGIQRHRQAKRRGKSQGQERVSRDLKAAAGDQLRPAASAAGQQVVRASQSLRWGRLTLELARDGALAADGALATDGVLAADGALAGDGALRTSDHLATVTLLADR